MGAYILCSSPLAQHPLKTRELGIDLYSAEELCYYIYHNYCVLEEDFISRELIDFLGTELNLKENAARIQRYAEDRPSLGLMLAYILREFRYYTDTEIKEFQVRFDEFRKHKPLERKLIKADFLLEQGHVLAALNIYHQFDDQQSDSAAGSSFVGNAAAENSVWFRAKQHMASAYVRLGLLEEAMDAYMQAWKLNPSHEELLHQMYCFSCFSNIPLSSEVFHEIDPMKESKWHSEYEETLTQAYMYASTGAVAAIFTKDAVRRKELIAEYIGKEKQQYRLSIQ